jgi:hypothetical protein
VSVYLSVCLSVCLSVRYVTGDCCNAGITLSEAKTEIRCLYEQIAHLKRDSRNKIVRQMRKHKQVNFKRHTEH